MKKKIIALMGMAVISCALLMGCGSKAETPAAETTTEAENSDEETAKTEETAEPEKADAEEPAAPALEVSGRPYLVFDAAFPQERVGDFDTCMTEEFFRALSDNAGFTLHLRCPYGKNSHHMIEALFKACAHALCDATAENSTGAVLSTKGTLSE